MMDDDHYFLYDGTTEITAGTTHLKTTPKFNGYFEIPQSITHLIFGKHYNQITNHLPQSITHLTFGRCYPLGAYRYQCENTDNNAG